MVYNKTFIKLFAAASIAGVIASCGADKSASDASDVKQDTLMVSTVDTTASAQAQAFFSSLPSPLHVARIFHKSGLKYSPGLTNPATNASMYSDQMAKSLNLGVYTADLAYASLNNKNQEAMAYFKAVRTLGDGLNMTSVFENTAIASRFEKNIGNKDSLVYLMSELQMESESLLKEANHYDVVYTSFVGAWVESLYLASSLSLKSPSEAINASITRQAPILDKLVKLLTDFQKNGEYDAMIADLKGIKGSMESISALNKPYNDASFKKAFKEDFYLKVETLRNKIVTAKK